MPGTSTRRGQPDCGATRGARGEATSAPARGRWRKCEGRKRDEFLERLFDWMSISVSNTSSLGARVPYSLNSEPDLSLNQRLAKWHFIALDVNRNGVCVLTSVNIYYCSFKSKFAF